MAGVTELTCNDRYGSVVKRLEDMEKTIYGNGKDGLITQASKNTDHRLEMQAYMRALNRKMIGVMVIGIGMLLAVLRDIISR